MPVMKPRRGLRVIGSTLLLAVLLLLPNHLFAQSSHGAVCSTPGLIEYVFSDVNRDPDMKPPASFGWQGISQCDCSSPLWLFCWKYCRSCPKWDGEKNELTGEKHDLMERLERLLKQNIIGQPRAIEDIVNAIATKNPNIPLSIHLVGDNATGKTRTATIIEEALFQYGLRKPALYIRCDSYISKDPTQTYLFRSELRRMIKDHLLSCSNPLIIVDEWNSLHVSTSIAFEPFLDVGYYEHQGSVQYYTEQGNLDHLKKAIFIFISDFGREGSTVGMDYEQVKLLAMESSTKEFATEKTTSLIQHTIPFMPINQIYVYDMVNALMNKLWTEPTVTNSQTTLKGISFCKKDQMLNGISEVIWNKFNRKAHIGKQYRGIENLFRDEVIVPIYKKLKEFLGRADLIHTVDQNKDIYLSLCTNSPGELKVEVSLPPCKPKKPNQSIEL